MTLVSQIISDAFRLGNLTATGQDPNAAEQTEALRYLNRLVKSVFGFEAGEPFVTFPIGSDGFTRPSGYPWWGSAPQGDWFVPKNTRLMLNLTESLDLYLHPAPDDGTRFSYVDVSGNLATYNLTLYGNGNKIGGASSQVLAIDSDSADYFYREDLGDWVKYAQLTGTDTFPFPEEFEDYFVTLLAIRLNPSFGITIDEQSRFIFDRARKRFASRYSQIQKTEAELGLVRLSNMTADRGTYNSLTEDTDTFNKGTPF